MPSSAVTDLNCCSVMCAVSLTGMAMIYSFMAVAVERVWATVRYKKYEHEKSLVFTIVLVLLPVRESDFVIWDRR